MCVTVSPEKGLLINNKQQNTYVPADGNAADPGGRLGCVCKRATDTLGAFLFLLPLAFIFDLAGYLPPYLRLFAVYALLALPLFRYPLASVVRGAAVLVAAILLNAFAPLPQVAEVLLLTFVHLWIWSLSGQVSGWLAQGVAFYALLHLLLFQSPIGFDLLEGINRTVIWFVRWIAGGTLQTGYTYQNVGSFLLFLSLSIHAWDRSAVSKARTAAFLLVILLLNGLLSAVLLFTVDLGPDLTWDLKFRDLFSYKELASYTARATVLVFPFFIFLGHAVAYLVLHHDAALSRSTAPAKLSAPDSPLRSRFTWAFLALAVLLLFVLIPPTTLRPTHPRKVSFLHRGVVSFTKPDYTRFSRAAGGMFGFVPEYAGLFGCPGEVVTKIPDPLGRDQVLVITNLDEPLSKEEFDRIWAFVRAGGGLWVLGDHTFIKNGRNHINDLLAPSHIRLNHDSAQFYPQGWFNSYRIRQGTAFSSLQDPAENRLSILVGASLALRPPARPLIMGCFGYGDWGRAEEDKEHGWIGDFKYQVNERLGDLVLVAGEQVGSGKVLVFGDTTSFFNLNLTRSFELLRAVLTWYGEPGSYGWFFSRAALRLALVLLVLALIVSVLGGSVRSAFGTLLVLALLSFAAHQGAGLPFSRDLARKRMAVIDFSQQPYASKHANMISGLFGLTVNLFRHDLMPVTQNDWNRELLNEAALLFLNAPQRPFSASQRRNTMEFMERGGVVLMSCGYPHYGNARSLLEPLGIEVLNIPLGRSFDRLAFGRPIHLFSAWPVKLHRAGAEVLAVDNDRPLIVEVPVGRGRLVLIPDSEFFHNINLENLESHSLPNIEFIRTLLDRVLGVPAP
ncbi:MAG: hypothetical protein WCK89_06085 [bacterium]